MRALGFTMLFTLLAAGCADPYAQTPPVPTTPPGELPAPPIPRPVREPERLAPSPEAAVRRAVELTGNWTGATIARQHERFAAETTGQARRDAERTAAQATTDPQLTGPGAKAVAILHAVVSRGSGPQRRLLVVTHETLRADGLTEARFRVYLAEAERHAGGWVLARWEPQP